MANPLNGIINAHRLLRIPGTRCPIGGQFMRDPVVLAGTGLSYERAAIAMHLALYGTDPESRTPLTAQQQRLLPNPALKDLIDRIRAAVGDVTDDEQSELSGPEDPVIE
jgi:hypothetical protein